MRWCWTRVGVERPVDNLGDTMRRRVEHVLVGGPGPRVESCLCAADWAIEVLLGSGYRAAPAAQEPREHVSAGVTAGPEACSQVGDVCPAHQASPEECRCDLEPADLVLDHLGARCADRPGLTEIARVLGNDASACWHRRRRPAVRSSISSASRTVRGSATALADGSGLVMAMNSITGRRTVTRLQFNVTVWGSSVSARVTRIFSRAVWVSMPHAQLS